MEATTVIRKPIVTEKSTWCSSMQNRYCFEIDRLATKPDVKQAVEELFGVRVLGVATQTRKGQMRRNKYGYWKTKEQKRAIVKVHPEDRIELF
ncbi:MAG: 50S ribosomal protein L23 [Phycisphaerales bacterium]|jgi:large subunit ribosomal protein L23|nr:50S ribosomal protein L23 [Phycisphaerales bacterium]MDG2292460.1 50S ribosomal protein L23 [Phycisphaerales bacterium]